MPEILVNTLKAHAPMSERFGFQERTRFIIEPTETQPGAPEKEDKPRFRCGRNIVNSYRTSPSRRLVLSVLCRFKSCSGFVVFRVTVIDGVNIRPEDDDGED